MTAKTPPAHGPGCVAGTLHFPVGDGWVDFTTSPNQGQMDAIETAQLLADYDTKGEFAMTLLVVAPFFRELEKGDEQYAVVKRALESYEATCELALAAPEVRERMVAASIALNSVCGRVLTAAWSYDGDPHEEASWAVLDALDANVVKIRALRIYSEWREALDGRLKAAGLR